MINPYLTNGLSHHHLESPLSFLGEIGVIFNFYFFFDEFSLSKQNSNRWDAAFWGVPSGAILFTYVPKKGCQAYTSCVTTAQFKEQMNLIDCINQSILSLWSSSKKIYDI